MSLVYHSMYLETRNLTIDLYYDSTQCHYWTYFTKQTNIVGYLKCFCHCHYAQTSILKSLIIFDVVFSF